MKCSDLGTLRAFADGELGEADQVAVSRHLGTCARCRDELTRLEQTAAFAAARLGQQIPASTPASWTAAKVRSQEVASHSPGTSRATDFGGWLVARRWRWTAAAAAVALTVMLVASPLQLAAQDFLNVFRVQRFAAVTVDPSQLPQLPKLTGVGDFQTTGQVKVHETTRAEASQAVDFAPRWPQGLPGNLGPENRTYILNGTEASLTLNLAAVEQSLTQMGVRDVSLPAGLNGATVRFRVPTSIVSAYGAATPHGTLDQTKLPTTPFLVFAQSRGPTVEVPDSVDIAALRTQLLALPLLPPDIARQLQAIDDWRHTMVIPVPAGTHRDVRVDGVPGLLITHADHGSTLLWQRNGVLYGLTGNLGENELAHIAGNLR